LARPLKVGIQLPEVEYVAVWPELGEMARVAEGIGLDSIWVGDHLLYRDLHSPPRGPWEAWSEGDVRHLRQHRQRWGPAIRTGPRGSLWLAILLEARRFRADGTPSCA